MKVIIIDYDDDEMSKKEVDLYRTALQARGHSVEACAELSELGELGDLKRYDVAICHRAWNDTDALDKEIEKRPEFRVIWTKFGYDCELLRQRESDQVIYISHPHRFKLIELVEKGWKCPP